MLDKIEDFDNVKYRVVCLLKAHKKARSSDKFLAQKYYRVYEGLEIPLTKTKVALETITRCRRKIQQHNPELRAKEEITEKREELRLKHRNHFSPNFNFKDMEEMY